MKELPYHIIFESSNDPQYIVDLKTLRFLAVNRAFVRISGYSKKKLVGQLKYNDLIPPEDLPLLQKIIQKRKAGLISERYQFRIQNRFNKIIPVEISAQVVKFDTYMLVIGSWRNIVERLKWEKAIREKVTELAQANNRILLLTEKIKGVPNLTSSLLKMPTEEHLIKNICDTLCEREKLNYESAIIYILKEHHLIYRYGKQGGFSRTRPNFPKKINISGNHILSKAFRYFVSTSNIFNRKLFWDNKKEYIILPLAGREKAIGLILLKTNYIEKELMESNPAAKKGYYDVLRTLINSIGLAIENIRLTEILKIQSIRDGLTDVYNRRYFENTLNEEFGRAVRYRRRLSLLLIDLDNFKTINDTYGHRQGDRILQEVAHLLQQHSRKIDSVCRYGGDEFAIILPETTLEGAYLKANNISQQIQNYRFTNLTNHKKPFKLKVSIGISILSNDIKTADNMVVAADKLLFRAKDKKNYALRGTGLPSTFRSR
ncbi:MAG: sensor domain-containing diguanylate cyclase [Planctomycetota bacterium]